MPRHLVRACSALVLTGALVLGAAACGGNNSDDARRPGTGTRPATPTPRPSIEGPIDIVGGYTSLRLNRQLADLLDLAGAEIAPAGAATRTQGAIRLPIARGRLDVARRSGRLEHRGGLRFRVGGADVRATKLVLDARSGVVTAAVAGKRVPLMTVKLGKPRIPQRGDVLVFTGSAGLSQNVAAMVNDRLGIGALRGGLPLGDVTVNARRR